MRFSTSFVALVAPLLVSAAPARFYGKRAASDIVVFKFADVLEQLESAFYTQALAKFQESDFTTAGFANPQVPIEQMKVMQFDEQTHSVALQSALKSFGEEPITNCKFNFEPVLKDLATTVATARVVENVGVSAYLGGATLITDPVLLDAAGSILSIEARHSTILNVLSAGSAIPSPFDIPLAPNEIIAIAAPFFDGPCDLGVPGNPTLTLTNAATPGTLLTFTADALNGTVSNDSLFCNMMVGGEPMSRSMKLSECVVPNDVNGPVAIWITSDDQPLINNVRDRATSQLVAGPTVTFVDTIGESIGNALRTGGGSSGGTTSTTQTISPAEASAVIASASGSAPAAAATGVSELSPKINKNTGNTSDGKITVKGWENIPSGQDA